jgi:hypothetical protein
MAYQMARPTGTGYANLDAPLVAEAVELIRSGRASSPTDAARRLAHRARGASPEAIVDRLVRRISAQLVPVYPGRLDGGESASHAGMNTRPDTVPAAEHRRIVAELESRIDHVESALEEAAEIALAQRSLLERQERVMTRVADRAEAIHGRLDAIEADAREGEYGASPSRGVH